VRLASGETIAADAVITTVALGVLARLVPDLDAGYAELLRRVEYQWATVLVLALDRPLSSMYWLTVTEPDCPFVVAVSRRTSARPRSTAASMSCTSRTTPIR
jgi:protoporphyrinogen oxidase